MDNLQEPEHLTSNTSDDDDYVFVDDINSDEDINNEIEWITVEFTESELKEFNAQSYLLDKYDGSVDEMLPSG